MHTGLDSWSNWSSLPRGSPRGFVFCASRLLVFLGELVMFMSKSEDFLPTLRMLVNYFCFVFLLLGYSATSFSLNTLPKSFSSATQIASSPSTFGVELTRNSDVKPSQEWELDCYSRPVVTIGGKKLWEVLITDSSGSFRFLKTLPSNQVNSKELRKTIEDLIEESDVKPNTVRFFRGAMFNMLNIAVSDLDVVGKPSRCTYAVAQWLEERHRDVYPNMEG